MKALVQTILNATAAGKSMLLAANAAAQKALLSLQNVDNTSDLNKPVSTAQQTALDAKLNLSGGTLTGDVTAGSNSFTAAKYKLGATSASGMIKQGTSTEAGNVPGVVIKDATDAGYMALHARRLTASDGLIGCWNGSDWNGWVMFADILVAKSTGRLAWSNTSSSLGGTEDLKMVRVSAGLASICGNAGLKVQNFAGNADAPLTCSTLTLSGGNNLAPITKAALLLLTPTASSAGRWRVTDATPANREAYPDGTDWRYTSDDTVVT